MSGILNGKTAVVTGASRGIGKAIALAMAEQGANVALISTGRAEEVCAGLSAIGVKAESFPCDVSDYAATADAVQKIIDSFGGIDILVNNAGITRDKLLMQMDEEDFDIVLDVNLKGTFNMIRHTARQFVKRRQGSIINISSVSGLMGNAGQANYSSAKAGMIGLTKTTAKELASRGITCNAIAPGFIATDMTGALSEAAKSEALNHIPMKRMGAPEEIAALAVFLASDSARYITGEVIRIDGGLYI